MVERAVRPAAQHPVTSRRAPKPSNLPTKGSIATRQEPGQKDRSMDVRHQRYFIAVAEDLHFGRAAERLHIEQSPLSRAIKNLESEIDVTLLERTPRGTRLTAAGRALLEDARRSAMPWRQPQKQREIGHRNQPGYRASLSPWLAEQKRR